jgi:hypothetical protein
MNRKLVTIEIPEFITHCKRRAPPKNYNKPSKAKKNIYWKIGGNSFYSQSINRFERDFVVKEMHSYIEKYLPKVTIDVPVYVEFQYYAPRNFGDVRIKSSKNPDIEHEISWKPYQSNYKARWDIGNLHLIWEKIGLDALRGRIDNGVKVSSGILVDDSIEYIKKSSCEWLEEPDLFKRKIVITIWQY